MYGIAAINAHNGWSIALIGATIVFLGLVFLSLAISRLHRILDMLENRDMYYRRIKQRWRPEQKEPAAGAGQPSDVDLRELVSQYDMLTRAMDEPFSLPRLLSLAEKRGLAHPHSSVNALVQSGVMEADGTGSYRWNHEIHDKILSEK